MAPGVDPTRSDLMGPTATLLFPVFDTYVNGCLWVFVYLLLSVRLLRHLRYLRVLSTVPPFRGLHAGRV